MLVLSRRIKGEILIGNDIRVVVTKLQGNTVWLAIEAPDNVNIVRKELVDGRRKNKPDAVGVINSVKRDKNGNI